MARKKILFCRRWLCCRRGWRHLAFLGLLARRLAGTGLFAPLIWFAVIAARFIPARPTRRRWRRQFAARRLNAAKRAAQFLDFTLVGELLALGDFDKFEHFVELVNHLLERFGNLRGMSDGFADGGSLGGTEIGGLNPLTLARRFRATFRTPNFRPTVRPRLARWFGDAQRLRHFASFRNGFGLKSFIRTGFVRGEFRGRFRMRFTKVTGGIGFSFRLFGGFSGFRGRRNFIRGRRNRFGRHRTWTAAAAATATAATIAAGTARRG
ncbi:MAG: hypothetical protein WCH99_08410 [Verrucomicrobiota bacterium]